MVALPENVKPELERLDALADNEATKMGRLADLLNGRPEDVGNMMRYVGLDNSLEIREKGHDIFQTKYLLGRWYPVMRLAYISLVGDNPLREGEKRKHLYSVTNAAREVLEDNLIPLKTIQKMNEEEVVFGPLTQVVYFNGHTLLDDGERVRITPYTPHKEPIGKNALTMTARINRSVRPCISTFDDITWQMEVNTATKVFGPKDYKGDIIKVGSDINWVRAKMERVSPRGEQLYGRPVEMAFREK